MSYVIAFFAAEVVFFFAFLIFSRISYKKRYELNYDHRNMFPYELNYESKFSENLIGNICFVIFALLNIGVFVLSMNYFLNDQLIFNLVTAILYTISVILVFFVPLKLLKTHLTCSTFLIGASFLNFAAMGFTLLNFSKLYDNNPSFIVVAIISFVIAVFYFLVIMNPKFTSWAKVDKVEQDGKVIYKRPKYFVLAFSEWLAVFGLIVSSLIATITYVLISL